MKKAELTDEQMEQFLLNVEEYKNSDSRVSLQNDIDNLNEHWTGGLIDTMSLIVKGEKIDSIFKKNMDAAQSFKRWVLRESEYKRTAQAGAKQGQPVQAETVTLKTKGFNFQ